MPRARDGARLSDRRRDFRASKAILKIASLVMAPEETPL
jgi:hypothetical protein